MSRCYIYIYGIVVFGVLYSSLDLALPNALNTNLLYIELHLLMILPTLCKIRIRFLSLAVARPNPSSRRVASNIFAWIYSRSITIYVTPLAGLLG